MPRTLSSSAITLARPCVSSSLQITNRSFRYASPHLWNQRPFSFRQNGMAPPLLTQPIMCYGCGLPGHIKRYCPMMSQGVQGPPPGRNSYSRGIRHRPGNAILFTLLLVHLILRIPPHHSHHLRSHHLSLPWLFTPVLKLISITNPFLHSHSDFSRTAFTALETVLNYVGTGVCLF